MHKLPRNWSFIGLTAALLTIAQPSQSAERTVMVTAIVEHKALDAVRDGVRDELKSAGFDAAKNLRYEFQSAQGNAGTAAQIARKYVGAQPDVIVAISTPSAQTIVAATKDVPVVYSAVYDPIAAKLVKTWAASGTNVTGVSTTSPLEKHIELVKRVVPTAKSIGVIYSPGEANSVAIVQALKKATSAVGLTLVEAPAARTIDVGSAAQSLIGKVDAIYTPTDSNVMAAFDAIVKVAQQAKIPLIAADTEAASRGAAASMGVNFYSIGRQTGKIVVRILNGEAPGTIPSQAGDKFELHVNPAAAIKQGVTLPDELIKVADTVVK